MSQTLHLSYRRLILELGQASADDATMRTAADFAHVLGLDLHAVFIEDEALMQVAALPFAREIRLPAHRWEKMDTGRLETELRAAADAAQRRLRRAIGDPGAKLAVQVLRGEPHRCIAGICTTADIIVMSPVDDARSAGMSLLRAAEESAASVLLVPPQAIRHTSPGARTSGRPSAGPVVVVAGGADDPGLALAARIAAAAREPLIVVLLEPGQSAVQLGDLGIPADQVTVRPMAGTGMDGVVTSLGQTRERIVVLTRQAMTHLDASDASRMAIARATPVLVL